MHVCERQAGTRSMHIQNSYNSNVNILLVSLLSRASGSLRTTPFHFFRNVLHLSMYLCIYLSMSWTGSILVSNTDDFY